MRSAPRSSTVLPHAPFEANTYEAKPSTAIETVVQEKPPTLNGSPTDLTGLNRPEQYGTAELDALTTEQLAELNLARMNDGTYMTVTMLRARELSDKPACVPLSGDAPPDMCAHAWRSPI